MSGHTARRAVTAAVLAAVTVLAAGCGGEGDGGEKDEGERPVAARTEAPRASVGPADPGRSGKPETSGKPEKSGKSEERPPEAGQPEDPADAPGPKVPEAELTPATGSFSKKQKDYLVKRVPEGTDPAAVLEAGQAACDRIEATAEVSREDAVSALRSGEIANAAPAVRHLCPEYAPLLDAAGVED